MPHRLRDQTLTLGVIRSRFRLPNCRAAAAAILSPQRHGCQFVASGGAATVREVISSFVRSWIEGPARDHGEPSQRRHRRARRALARRRGRHGASRQPLGRRHRIVRAGHLHRAKVYAPGAGWPRRRRRDARVLQAAAGPRPMTAFLRQRRRHASVSRLRRPGVRGPRRSRDPRPGAGRAPRVPRRRPVPARRGAGGPARWRPHPGRDVPGSRAQSVASAAVQLVGRDVALADSHVVVVGAGATGVKVARHLRAVGVKRLVVANRTRGRADAAASTVAAESTALEIRCPTHWPMPTSSSARWMRRCTSSRRRRCMRRSRRGAAGPLIVVDV